MFIKMIKVDEKNKNKMKTRKNINNNHGCIYKKIHKIKKYIK